MTASRPPDSPKRGIKRAIADVAALRGWPAVSARAGRTSPSSDASRLARKQFARAVLSEARKQLLAEGRLPEDCRSRLPRGRVIRTAPVQ